MLELRITCGKRSKNLWKHIGLQSRVQSNIHKRKSRGGSILTSCERKVRATSHNGENISESNSKYVGNGAEWRQWTL